MASLHQTELALAAALGQTPSLPNQANTAEADLAGRDDLEAAVHRQAGASHNPGDQDFYCLPFCMYLLFLLFH